MSSTTTYPCSACHTLFASSRALTRHTNDCEALQTRFNSIRSKRKAKAAQKRARKKQRRAEKALCEEEWEGLGLSEADWIEAVGLEPEVRSQATTT